jgi:large subunit ribosomal protein L1
VGKKSFSPEAIVANAHAFLESVKAARPGTAKGVYMLKATISTTMSPGIPLVLE